MRTLKPRSPGRTSRSGLYRQVAGGNLERIARGLYVPADAPPADWDQLEAVARRPEATICLTSALAAYDLIDDIPDALDVAIPRNKRMPASEGAIRWHRFDEKTFDVGRDLHLIRGIDQPIHIYSAERTIADCFRLRGVIGYETARDATKVWLRRGGQPSRLLNIARELPRTLRPVQRALEVLA